MFRRRSDGWQRDYFQGHHVDGTHGVPAHQTRLHLASFRADDESRTGSDHRTSATGTASAAPATHEGGST